MHITIVFATAIEAQMILEHLRSAYEEKEPFKFHTTNGRIDVLITGIGLTQTALTLGLYLAHQRPDLLINAGIAGSLDPKLDLGAVVHVTSERFADLGVENADESFQDWNEMGWAQELTMPLVNGELHNPEGAKSQFLPNVKGISVQKVHGSVGSIAKVKAKYPTAQVESMEGAAIFLACLQQKITFFEIRAISNRVEPRNKENWDIALALRNLNATLISLLEALK